MNYHVYAQNPDLFLKLCEKAEEDLSTLCKGDAFKFFLEHSGAAMFPENTKPSKHWMQVEFISTLRTTYGNQCITRLLSFYHTKRRFESDATPLDACLLSCKENVLSCLTDDCVTECVMSSNMYPQGVFVLNNIIYVVSTVVFPDVNKMPDFKLQPGCSVTPFKSLDELVVNERDQIIRNSFVEVLCNGR